MSAFTRTSSDHYFLPSLYFLQKFMHLFFSGKQISAACFRILFSLSVFLAFHPVFLQAQEENAPALWVSANALYGFVIAHNENMLYLVDGHAPGCELSLFKTTDGSKPWQRAYRNPEA